MVLRSDLNSSNKIAAVNTLAIPVVSYSFNIINWQMQEVKKMDAKTRKIMTMTRMNHLKAGVDRIYVSREEGGRRLIQLECTYRTSKIGLEIYLKEAKDKLLKQVYRHESDKKLYSIHKDANRFQRELDIQIQHNKNGEKLPITKIAKCAKRNYKETDNENMKEKGKGKPLHGQYPERVDREDVDKEVTYK